MLYKKDVAKAPVSSQLREGQNAGTETVIHTMWDIFANVDTDVAENWWLMLRMHSTP